MAKRSKSRSVAEAWLAERVDIEQGAPPVPRYTSLVAARLLGTHTEAEAREKALATRTCRYCLTALNAFNRVADHIKSIKRGGSDAIDNIQHICWECNNAKADKDHYEYNGPVRPFRPIAIRIPTMKRMVADGYDPTKINDASAYGLRLR